MPFPKREDNFNRGKSLTKLAFFHRLKMPSCITYCIDVTFTYTGKAEIRLMNKHVKLLTGCKGFSQSARDKHRESLHH